MCPSSSTRFPGRPPRRQPSTFPYSSAVTWVKPAPSMYRRSTRRPSSCPDSLLWAIRAHHFHHCLHPLPAQHRISPFRFCSHYRPGGRGRQPPRSTERPGLRGNPRSPGPRPSGVFQWPYGRSSERFQAPPGSTAARAWAASSVSRAVRSRPSAGSRRASRRARDQLPAGQGGAPIRQGQLSVALLGDPDPFPPGCPTSG